MRWVEHPLLDKIEELRSLSHARRNWFPKPDGGRDISPATIHRWVRYGVHGVRLEVVHTPRGAVTSRSACQQFLHDVDQARRAKMPETQDVTDEELASVGLDR